MDGLVVCEGCSSHAQARAGAASSSSCPPAASLPVPHFRLPIITAPEQKLLESLKELEKSLAMQVRLKPESESNFVGTSIYSMNFPLDSVDRFIWSFTPHIITVKLNEEGYPFFKDWKFPVVFILAMYLQTEPKMLIRHGLDLLPMCNIFGKVIQVKLGIGRALFYSATRTCPQGTQLMSLPLFLVKQQMQHT
ncbi:unnamed protein product [Triticum turgidum subsp. durum]|uniref:Uncharacterized protein n=1 Tax=Triticum turgidum subsp. durum TaxID=4567 RepID=A0A9R0UW48_TRITD|nr:unnamed protein product [Triticum turgidum subsp. durum]